jgi:hypothetical protein
MSALRADEERARETFVHRLIETRQCWAIIGDEGMARVPSPIDGQRTVHLVWIDRREAERWATALVSRPRMRMITLVEMTTEMIPKLTEMRRLIGTDWTSAPVEAEIEPSDLDTRIRASLLDRFLDAAEDNRQVWVLRHPEGLACTPSRQSLTGDMLPVWSDRASAEAAARNALEGTVPARVPLADFTQRVLMWCTETRRRVAPEFVPGPGALELQPWELKARMNGERADKVA